MTFVDLGEAGAHLPSAMPGRKRTLPTSEEQSRVCAAVESGSAVSAILGAFDNLSPGVSSGSLRWQRKLAQDELYKCARVVTPYGTICEEATLDGHTAALEIYHINPFALLYHCMASSGMFATFMVALIGRAANHTLEFCFYLDKARPGNQAPPQVGAFLVSWPSFVQVDA